MHDWSLLSFEAKFMRRDEDTLLCMYNEQIAQNRGGRADCLSVCGRTCAWKWSDFPLHLSKYKFKTWMIALVMDIFTRNEAEKWIDGVCLHQIWALDRTQSWVSLRKSLEEHLKAVLSCKLIPTFQTEIHSLAYLLVDSYAKAVLSCKLNDTNISDRALLTRSLTSWLICKSSELIPTSQVKLHSLVHSPHKG